MKTMLTTTWLWLLPVAAASLAASPSAVAEPGIGIALNGRSLGFGDPGITLVAKRSGSPFAIEDANDKNRRAIQDPNERNNKLGGKNSGNPRAFNPQPDPPGNCAPIGGERCCP